MKHLYSGKSLNELYDEYGEGADGFFSHWWKAEAFADEKQPKGIYELNIETKQLTNLTYDKQTKQLPKGWKFPHPAILAEALIEYHHKTDKYLMEDWCSRTTALDSDGDRVDVGGCGSGGVGVRRWYDGRYGRIGVSASRKSTKKLEPGGLESIGSSSLELRVSALEETVKKLTTLINL